MLKGTCHCGRVGWTLAAMPESGTACSCTICRRYGALWAYGHIEDDIHVSGEATTYRRADGGAIDFYFCARCGCIAYYISTKPSEDGRRWTAVNLRMTEPGQIADLPIDHFDGHDTWEDLPRDGRRLKDMWF